jgi:catalase
VISEAVYLCPTLFEDFVQTEKIFHFDHKGIRGGIVHARSPLFTASSKIRVPAIQQ